MAKSFPAFVREAREAMAESILRIKSANNAAQVVVVVDGLEKIQPSDTQERAAIELSLELVFVKQAHYLRQDFHTIYTFPQWLRFAAGRQLGTLFHGEPQVLSMVSLAPRNEKCASEGSEGTRMMAELLHRRMGQEGFAKIFGDGACAVPLLMASGGYPRHLLRLVRNVLLYPATFPLSAQLDHSHPVNQVIEQLRETYERGVLASQIDILAEVARSHAMPHANANTATEFYRLGRALHDLGLQ